MKYFRSLARIVVACGMIVAVGSNVAPCLAWDPLGLQQYQEHHEYKPFGKYGPQLNIDYVNPNKVMNGGRSGQPNPRTAQRSASSRTVRLNDLNLLVTMPKGPWEKLDPKNNGSRATYLISRNDPTIVISLAGEQAGAEAGDTNASLLAASKAKMTSLPGGVIEPGERKLYAGGIPGIAYKAKVVDGEYTTYYSIWVAAYRGYNYKLAVYGDQEDKPAVDAAMRDFLRGMKQIQSTRVARTNGGNRTATR